MFTHVHAFQMLITAELHYCVTKKKLSLKLLCGTSNPVAVE